MKIWKSYGSEHSADLVMIGRFKDAQSAEDAKAAIDELTTFMSHSDDDYSEAVRYPDEVMKLLRKLCFHSVSPRELDQFRYDVSYQLKDTQIVLRTDEPDISAFLKLMVDRGARVEVYSAPDYPESATNDQAE